MHFAIAAVLGFFGTLVFANSWQRGLIVGALASLPWAVFHVYMMTGGTNGAGFDPSQLPESTGSMAQFLFWVCLFMAAAGAIGGLFGAGIKKLFRG